jgi:hypothetical protein
VESITQGSARSSTLGWAIVRRRFASWAGVLELAIEVWWPQRTP